MHPSYDAETVALSVLIAIVASYTALALARKHEGGAATGRHYRWSAALTMGIGVWTMHFIAMLAFHLPVPVAYDFSLTLLSMAFAVTASGFAFDIMAKNPALRRRLFASACLGLGIAAMHYTGMAAMRMAPPIRYEPWGVALSLAATGLVSFLALSFAFCWQSPGTLLQGVAAVLMGGAICGLHFSAMAATEFAPGAVSLAMHWGLAPGNLVGAVAGATFWILLLSLFHSLSEPVRQGAILLLLIAGAETAIMVVLNALPPASLGSGQTALLDGALLALFLLPILRRLQVDSARLVYEKERAKTTLASIADGVIVTDGLGRAEFLNAAVESLIGWSDAEARGKPLADLYALVRPAGRSPLENPAEPCRNPEPRAADHSPAVLIARDGRERNVEYSAAAIPDGPGQNLGTVLVFRDITEKRRAERAIRAAQDDLLSSHRNQLTLNALLRMPLVDLPMEEVLARALDAVLETPWLSGAPSGAIVLLDPESGNPGLRASRNYLPAVVEDRASGSSEPCPCGHAPACGKLTRNYAPDARYEICFAPLPGYGRYCVPLVLQGRMLGVMVLHVPAAHAYSPHDAAFLESVGSTLAHLIQRKRYKDELRLAASVFEHAGEAIVISDADFTILRVNRAFCAITGFAEADAVGRRPELFAANPEQDLGRSASLRDSVRQHGEWQGEIWNRRKTGEVYPAWLSIRAIQDEQGVVRQYIGIFSDISAFKEAEERIKRLAYYDHLTGLANRTLLADHFDMALAQAHRRHDSVAAIFIDLDHFKTINDSLGHACGDLLLQEAATRLRALVRDGDTVARLGGDEFVLCLPDAGRTPARAEMAAGTVATKIQAQFLQPFRLHGRELVLTPSIGIAFYPWDAETRDELIKHADVAMYHAKKLGRDNVQFYAPKMRAAGLERLEMQNDLRKTLERGELELHYQPKVCVSSGRILGAEALLRWHHPVWGWIPPGRFIPLAEETNLILPIGDWVLRAVCRQLESWYRQGLLGHGGFLPIAVNVSPRQFSHPDFAQRLAELLSSPCVQPDWLEIEVTEESLMPHSGTVVKTLKRLKHLGIRISIDDFGIGYSSLGYLKQFPVDVLKIDRSFIQDVPENSNDAAIVRAIVALADSLNLEATAEGVESPEQLDFLRELQCEHYQGFLFSRPLPAAEFAALVENQNARVVVH